MTPSAGRPATATHTLLIQGTTHTLLTIQGTTTHPPHHTGYYHTPSLYRVPPHTLLTIQGTITHPPYTGYHRTPSSPYRYYHTPSSPYRVPPHTLLTIQGTTTHPLHNTGYHHTPSSPYRVPPHTLFTIQGTTTHPLHNTGSQAANHSVLEPIITLQLTVCAKNPKCVRHVFLTS